MVLGYCLLMRSLLLLWLGVLWLAGCGGVSSYAVPTSGRTLPPSSGAIAIYATREPAEGRELGVVEAKAAREEGSVEVLFPELVRRAQELGANALVIDTAGARFELVTTWTNQQQLVPCGSRSFCTVWQPVASTHEEMVVVLRGRAWLLPAQGEQP